MINRIIFVSPFKLDKKLTKNNIKETKNPKPIKSIIPFFILEPSLSLNKCIVNEMTHKMEIINMIVNAMLDITRLLKKPPGYTVISIVEAIIKMVKNTQLTIVYLLKLSKKFFLSKLDTFTVFFTLRLLYTV